MDLLLRVARCPFPSQSPHLIACGRSHSKQRRKLDERAMSQLRQFAGCFVGEILSRSLQEQEAKKSALILKGLQGARNAAKSAHNHRKEAEKWQLQHDKLVKHIAAVLILY